MTTSAERSRPNVGYLSSAIRVRSVPMRKTVHNAIDSCELHFDDHAIPGEYLIGQEGQGFEHMLSALNSERVLAAASLALSRL